MLKKREAIAAQMLRAQISIVRPGGIQNRLALEDDIRIPRDEIIDVMRDINDGAFIRRAPAYCQGTNVERRSMESFERTWT
jgi:hypothetical protein